MPQNLRVAVVHYHLRPGGVTRVAERAAEAVSASGVSTVVLCGETPQSGATSLKDVGVIEELAYTDSLPGKTAQNAVAEMTREATRLLGGEPDLWHFHNHSLGKNPLLPQIVDLMADAGHKLLLQMHDFAEDGRPANYRFMLDEVADGDVRKLGQLLYPQRENVHYAVLNRRDYSFLINAGVAEDRLHHLPNAVCAAPPKRPDEADDFEAQWERLILYPTRAIRRKNLGELLFWSALASPGEVYATTLIPKNPLWQTIHEEWVNCAKELNLPVSFGLGAQYDFDSLVATADCLVTTSVAEGFGLAFLEPWLSGKNLSGRKLPEITDEFEDGGVDLGGLYSLLPVPLEWVGEDVFRDALRQKLSDAFAAYGREVVGDDVERAFAASVSDGKVDFGRLDEDMQRKVISHVVASGLSRESVGVTLVQESGNKRNIIGQNRAVIEDKYSLAGNGARLFGIYNRVAASGNGVASDIDAGGLLDCFLAPERFFLLRS